MRRMSEAFRKSLAMYGSRMPELEDEDAVPDDESGPAEAEDESAEDELGIMAVLRELIPWAARSHR